MNSSQEWKTDPVQFKRLKRGFNLVARAIRNAIRANRYARIIRY